MEKYIPQDIEKKWQGVWAESHADKTAVLRAGNVPLSFGKLAYGACA